MIIYSPTSFIPNVTSHLKNIATIKVTLKILSILVLFSCADESKKVSDFNSENKKEKTETKNNQLTEYNREWIEYDYVKTGIRERFEIYISKKKDTIGFQKMVYKNNILDTTKSNFYNLKAEFLKDSTLKGSLKVFLEDEFNIKSRLIENKIEVYFAQDYNNKRDIVEFKSINSNNIDFEFKNNSDTLMGLIILQRQFDTIMDGKEMIRIIEKMIPVDNKIQTNNIFIDAFELNKNER